jgi:phosphoglycolate phosphatase-like HAD superfamily hydrolase
VPRIELHKQVGKASDLLISEFVEDEETVERVDEMHSGFYSELQEHGHPPPGPNELIPSLAERGYEVWFVTSAKDEELEHYMSELEAEGRNSASSTRATSRTPSWPRYLRADPGESRRLA